MQLEASGWKLSFPTKKPLLRGACSLGERKSKSDHGSQQLADAQAGLVQPVDAFRFAQPKKPGNGGMVALFHVMQQKDQAFGRWELDHGPFQVNPHGIGTNLEHLFGLVATQSENPN